MSVNEIAIREVFVAAAAGDLAAVLACLTERPDLVAAVDHKSRTALHVAAYFGQVAVLESLLERGADANTLDAGGFSPLYAAAWAGRLDTVRALIRHGADIDARGDNVATPLRCAEARGHAEVAALLRLMGSADSSARPDAEGPASTKAGIPMSQVRAWMDEHEVPEPSLQEKPEVYGACDWCGRTIHVGNACVTVNRHIEQVDWNPEAACQEIQVIDAEAVLTLCAACGSRVNTDGLREFLRAAGG